jgi:CRP-like cAMP-binding protein
MGEDWWIASIDRIEDAATDLDEALEAVLDALREARSRRLEGVGDVDIAKGLVARGGRQTRLGPTAAFRKFEAALTDCRAAMIRALVDGDHMTFTEVGELIGVSRQMVARLYRRPEVSGPATGGRNEN